MENDGALPKLSKPIRFGLGAAVGSGNQWVPWIHIDDMTEFYLKAVEHSILSGVYNAVAPNHVNQTSLMKAIGQALDRPVFLPAVPSFLLKMVMGEMAKVITEGSRVSCQKLLEDGFEFQHPKLKPALIDLLK
jgi:uncharacterized protein (TIGR01777 family)